MVPDLLPAMASKNPQVKEGTLKFLARCLATSPLPLPPAQLKSVSEPLASLLDDGFEGARNEAAICLGTLMKMVGERPLNALLNGLADVRKSKVTEAYEKATIKCKVGGVASAPKAALVTESKPASKPTAPKKNILEDEPPKKPVAKPSARVAVSSNIFSYHITEHIQSIGQAACRTFTT